MEIKQNDIITLTITDLSHDGKGIGRHGEVVVFVPGALPEETVEVKITQCKKKFAEAQLTKVIDNVYYRTEPACPHYATCGGCDFMHIKYDNALELKRKMLHNNLTKIGKLTFPLQSIEIIPAHNQLYYRNKVLQPVGKNNSGALACGFFREGTHNIVEIPSCKIEDTRCKELLNYLIEEIKKAGITPYDEATHTGYLRAIGYRLERRTKHIMLIFVTTVNDPTPLEPIIQRADFRFENIKSVYLNVNPTKTNRLLGDTNVLLSGVEYLDMYLGKAIYKVAPQTFFQVNSEQAEKLFQKVIEFLPFERWGVVWDLYAGVGAISFFIASEFKRIYLVEQEPESVRMAEMNKRKNMADNVTIFEGDLEHFDLSQLEKPDVVILDPPRKGVSDSVIATLRTVLPKKIIMISCNTATLARDIQRLSDNYIVKNIAMVDMFPQTHHIETVTALERIERE